MERKSEVCGGMRDRAEMKVLMSRHQAAGEYFGVEITARVTALLIPVVLPRPFKARRHKGRRDERERERVGKTWESGETRTDSKTETAQNEHPAQATKQAKIIFQLSFDGRNTLRGRARFIKIPHVRNQVHRRERAIERANPIQIIQYFWCCKSLHRSLEVGSLQGLSSRIEVVAQDSFGLIS